jgi:hypothetical protein
MPGFCKICIFRKLLFVLICSLVAHPCLMQANEEIRHYYVRYDIKSSGNRLVESKLTMVPAENEFRAENFSQVRVKGAISSVPGNSPETSFAHLTLPAKRDALKRLLREKGLKSVTSRDADTVVSYEGAVKTPVKLLDRQYNKETGRFEASFQVVFSPTAFPDRWDELEFKDRVKKLFSDFLQLLTP